MKDLTLEEIANLLANGDLQEDQLKALGEDPRRGTRRLLEKYFRSQRKQSEERERLYSLTAYERKARNNGYNMVAGVDEAGRGPLAGPVVAAAVILPPGGYFPRLNDSKKLSPAVREALFASISERAVGVGIGIVDIAEIERLNIHWATIQAMREAVERLDITPDYILVDGFPVKGLAIRQEAIKGGDGLSLSIAAASVMAKVTRDRIMLKLDEQYPRYGFSRNKGYASEEHLKALQKYGPSPVHRPSFLGIGEDGESREKNRFTKGAGGEEEAFTYLLKEGYTIAHKNYRCPAGEIDLVAEKEGVLVFVEVRTRWSGGFSAPEESLSYKKKERLLRAGGHYLKVKVGREVPCRFDLVALDINPEGKLQRLNHLKNILPG